MPNWTNNRLSIRGTKEDIAKFLADGKADENGVYSMNSWVAMPQTFIDYDTTNHPYGEGLKVGKPISYHDDAPICTEETIEEFKKASKYQEDTYGVIGWYNWACAHWGTKWDADFSILCQTEERIDFGFDTAWSLPTYFIETIAERYPNLTIRIYSHFEDSGNIAYEFEGGGEPTDMLIEFIDIITEMKDDVIKDGEGEDLSDAYDEWMGQEQYNLATLSEYLEDDGDAFDEVSAEFYEWYECCYHYM